MAVSPIPKPQGQERQARAEVQPRQLRGCTEMTQDEIIKALRQVVEENQHYTTWTVSTPHLVLLVNLVIEHEREACAKVCEQTNDGTPYNLAEACAEAIRARGQA